MNTRVHQLINEQLNQWAEVRKRYDALHNVQSKELMLNGNTYRMQFNPARLISSGAKTDAKSIQKRPCFLCENNRPAEQKGLPFKSRYTLLINPFPIFPEHLTIPDMCHVEQRISERFGDMLALAASLTDFTIFYNGPHCGASAPDHMHFQAGSRGFMPIEQDWEKRKAYEVTRLNQAVLWRLNDDPRSTWVIESTNASDAEKLFQIVYQALPLSEEDAEPKLNLLTYYENGQWVSFILPRNQHRPTCYYATDNQKLLCSPASVDLGGVFILPIEADFQKITKEQVTTILQEVCLPASTMEITEQQIRQYTEPQVNVGILSATQIEFTLLTDYTIEGKTVKGQQSVSYASDRILWNGQYYSQLIFIPQSSPSAITPSFELENVTIGIHFHWERQESQRFPGILKIIVNHNQLTAINVVQVEDYLTSVISSEMSATASPALLQAHAVISRSWLLAQLQEKKTQQLFSTPLSINKDTKEYIRWYDHEDHILFDVCADDHCQRYQGITRASTPQVQQAITHTRGEVLMWHHKICDARFSKCCGGALEEFPTCWENQDYPYLHRRRDWKEEDSLPDLTQEAAAEHWIREIPPAFCQTSDAHILSQVLNNYDQETTDFYRWKISYSQSELSALIHQKTGIDFGAIIDLKPIARGTSGRLWKLQIIGTKHTLTLGKELEIRRTLSHSHLYSSAFVIDKDGYSPEGIPGRFILTGAGWGHGVGLCQIGAAVMGEKGYSYQDILHHYYTNATIEKLY